MWVKQLHITVFQMFSSSKMKNTCVKKQVSCALTTSKNSRYNLPFLMIWSSACVLSPHDLSVSLLLTKTKIPSGKFTRNVPKQAKMLQSTNLEKVIKPFKYSRSSAEIRRRLLARWRNSGQFSIFSGGDSPQAKTLREIRRKKNILKQLLWPSQVVLKSTTAQKNS